MDLPLRAALIGWLAADPDLSVQLNAMTEEAPSRTSLPWLAISTSASADWSTKTETGYEIRIAMELMPGRHARCRRRSGRRHRCASSQPARAADRLSIVTQEFMRARVAQIAESSRTILVEYRFRTIAD
jgi:hypothetical protein